MKRRRSWLGVLLTLLHPLTRAERHASQLIDRELWPDQLSADAQHIRELVEAAERL